MYKNKRINTLMLISFISLLSACGGSDGTANEAYNGVWETGVDTCEFVTAVGEANELTLTISGATATFTYSTFLDCTGSPTDTTKIAYSLDFVGTQEPSTSACLVDDKVNLDIQSVTYNGTKYSGVLLDLALSRSDFDDVIPKYSLLCINEENTKLYFPENSSGDGLTSATRPTTIFDEVFLTRTAN